MGPHDTPTLRIAGLELIRAGDRLHIRPAHRASIGDALLLAAILAIPTYYVGEHLLAGGLAADSTAEITVDGRPFSELTPAQQLIVRRVCLVLEGCAFLWCAGPMVFNGLGGVFQALFRPPDRYTLDRHADRFLLRERAICPLGRIGSVEVHRDKSAGTPLHAVSLAFAGGEQEPLHVTRASRDERLDQSVTPAAQWLAAGLALALTLYATRVGDWDGESIAGAFPIAWFFIGITLQMFGRGLVRLRRSIMWARRRRHEIKAMPGGTFQIASVADPEDAEKIAAELAQFLRVEVRKAPLWKQ